MSTFTSLSEIRSHKHRIVLLTAILIFVSLFGGWFDPATTPRLSAWQVGIAQGPNIPADPINLLSFGVAGALLCLLLWRAAWSDHRPLMALASVSLLFLAFDFYLQIAVSRPAWLKEALDGTTDFQRIMSFANRYSISTQYPASPDSGVAGVQSDLPDRITATYDCMGYAWLWFIAGSLACLFGAYHGRTEEAASGRQTGLSLRPWFLAFILIVIVQTISPVMAQYDFWRGDQAASRNDAAQAERYYRGAIRLDEWYQIEPYAYLKIGALRKSNGDQSSPEACLAIGVDLIARGFYPEGIDRLAQAKSTRDPLLAAIVADQIADLSIIQGLAYYQQGAQAVAREEWIRSLEAKPGRLAAYYMIGKAEYDLANFSKAREWYSRAQDKSTLPVIQATCLSAIGDTYYFTGEVALARAYYLKSLALSHNLNFRAMKSLIDDYYQ